MNQLAGLELTATYVPVPAAKLRIEPHAEPIAGYFLLELLGRGGYGEVWKCEAPGGLFKAIKFVHGDLSALDGDNAAARQELQALQRVKMIRHPFILSMERVEIIRGRLIIVSELADRNLYEVHLVHRTSGQQGIPRGELLSYLRETAEALDWMNLQFGLQHLDIKPRNLLLVSNHVKVADFGLVTSLWETGTKEGLSPFMGMSTPPYCSPEVFRGAVSPYSDQYSLAIVYQELLTGTFPFKGKNPRQLALQHDQAAPDLAPLPASDRPVVARALAKDPRQRFPSCSLLVEALCGAVRGETIQADAVAMSNGRRRPREKRRARDLSAKAIVLNGQASPLGVEPMPSPPQNAALEEFVPAVGELRAGVEFLACLDHSPMCEVWKVRTLDGKLRMAKFSHSFGLRNNRREQEAVKRLASLTHPSLARAEVIDRRPGSLILVMDLPTATLGERLQEYRAQGLSGLPRWELLEAMRRTAEGLDYLWQRHGIQHLALNPNSIVQLGEEWRVADAGLMHWLWSPAGHAPFQLNALYSAPELFEKQSCPACDQYSLALIYLEMLTGRQPLLGHSPRQVCRLRRDGKLNLDLLPAADRPIVLRALHPDPTQRFETCGAMVAALEMVSTNQSPLVRGLPPIISSAWSQLPAGVSGPIPSAEQIVTQMLATATAATPVRNCVTVASMNNAGQGLNTRFQAELEPHEARPKLEAFCRQWQGRLVCSTEDLLICHLSLPRGFLQRYFSRPVGLEVQVHLGNAVVARRREIEIELSVFGCDGKRAEKLLSDLGPVLMGSLRDFLLSRSEQRRRERLPCTQSLIVYPVVCNFELGPALECRTRDVSLSGIGFLSPQALTTSQIYLNPTPSPDGGFVAILAQVVRMEKRKDGQYDVGAFFKFDEIRNV